MDKSAGKYTESELKDRGVGKGVDSRDQNWHVKKATYGNEGIWNSFTSLRDCFRCLLRNCDGYTVPENAHRQAGIMMDAFLIRRSRGEKVKVPKESETNDR